MVYLVDSAGRADHRPDRPVPRPPRRREDLLEPGAGERLDPAGLRAVRAVRGRRRVHPGVLRRRRHGRGQRLDVPRLRPDGRDGHRREDHAGGDGRRPGALRRVRRRALPGRDRAGGARHGARLPVVPAVELAGHAAARRARPAPANVDLAALVPDERAAGVRHAPLRQGPARRGLVLRDPRAVGPRGHGRLRPARRRGRRRRRQQLDVQGRRAVRRLRRQGDPVRAAVRRVQRAAGLPLRRARLHGRARRSRRPASSGTARR